MKRLPLFLVGLFTANFIAAQTLEEGKLALKNENFPKARNILRKIYAETGDKKSAYYLGNAYLRLDEPDSAKIFYNIGATDGKTAYAYLSAARIAVLDNNLTKAKSDLNLAAVTSKMKDAEVLYQAGDALYKPTTVDLAAAISFFEDAYKVDTKHWANMLELGDAYLDNNEGGKAMSKYESGAEINKTLALPQIKIGRLSNRGKMYENAVDAYKKAINLDPNNPLPYWEIGEVYYLSKQYDKAKESFQKYLQLNTDDEQANLKLIVLLNQLKDYEQVIAESKKLLQKDPKNYVLYRALMYSYFEQKNYTEGQNAMKNFWENVPANKVKAYDYTISAKIAATQKDTATVFNYYEKAIEMNPKDADLAAEYAKALYDAKKYDKAITVYNDLISKFGGSSLDYYYLGRSYYITKNYATSDSTFAKFIEKQPTSPDGYKWRAKANTFLDPEMKTGASKPYYEKLIELLKNDPQKYKKDLVEAYHYLAIYAHTKKDMPAVKSYLEQAVAIDPSNKETQELINSLK